MKGWSYAQDRRLIEMASSSKSLEAVAKQLNRKPAAVARTARRLGIFLSAKRPPSRSRRADPVPARASHIPTYRERAILQPLVGRDWLPAGKLSSAAAPSTLTRMIAKGWLERQRDGALGWTYRATETGQAALKLLIPSKQRQRIGKPKASPAKN